MSTADTPSGPVVLVSHSGAVISYVSTFLPAGSLVVIEEPDVVRKRDLHALSAAAPGVRELIEFEYLVEGSADAFYLRHRALAPSAVVPVSEYAVPFAARLAERYGVPGAGYGAAMALRDKRLLRRVTGAAGIANPESVEVGGPGEVEAFMVRTGGPIVLKPANRQASVGTKILHDPAEVAASWAECVEHDEGVMMPDRPLPLRMLAERLVRGDEYSVELMFHNGQARYGEVTRKFLYDGPRPIERGHLHPADITADLRERLIADTVRVLDAVGMDCGFVHCEWIVEDGVPHLVECAGRMAGDGIIELALMCWDFQFDMVVQFYDMMRGRPYRQTPSGRPPGYAAAWLGDAPAGEVERVDGEDAAKAVPGVRTCAVSAKVGQQVHELRSSWDRVSLVTAVGGTSAEALERARTAAELITVTVRSAVPVAG